MENNVKSRFGRKAIIVLICLVVVIVLANLAKKYMGFDTEEHVAVKENSILHLDPQGVIMNGKKFLKNLKKYKDDKDIKAVIININSPGGAVGPSQEIYTEIKRFREETKKPVICVSTGIIASGAYYSAVACDKIIVAPGALIGSIGVIMEFANLEKLYDWAKISRYSITSGKFKDSGAEYRSMRDDEKALFQDMINEVYGQFKKTVMDGRKLKEEVMTEYADGRVFTGNKAVELGFADKAGTYEDAVRFTAEYANLGKDYEVFEIPKKKHSIWDLMGDNEEDDLINGISHAMKKQFGMSSVVKEVLRPELLNQPLFLMPGTWPQESE